MHHVAVPLHEHQVLHPHRAELAHPPHIVAPKIDQHDVLGDLFLIRAQIGFHRAVLHFIRTARPRPGDRPVLDVPPMHAHQQLRRRPDNVRARSASSSAASSSPNRRKYIYGEGFTIRSAR